MGGDKYKNFGILANMAAPLGLWVSGGWIRHSTNMAAPLGLWVSGGWIRHSTNMAAPLGLW